MEAQRDGSELLSCSGSGHCPDSKHLKRCGWQTPKNLRSVHDARLAERALDQKPEGLRFLRGVARFNRPLGDGVADRGLIITPLAVNDFANLCVHVDFLRA